MVEQIMRARKDKALLLIDISMPRNVDPAVADVTNVILKGMHDWDKVVEKKMKGRSGCVTQVEEMIEHKVQAFYDKLRKINNIETIGV